MTDQEAIEIIKKDGWGYPENMHTEAVMMAIDALEKRTQKKIIPADEKKLAEKGWYMCPVCHTLEYYSYKSNYCDVCGQRLDWSEAE